MRSAHNQPISPTFRIYTGKYHHFIVLFPHKHTQINHNPPKSQQYSCLSQQYPRGSFKSWHYLFLLRSNDWCPNEMQGILQREIYDHPNKTSLTTCARCVLRKCIWCIIAYKVLEMEELYKILQPIKHSIL